MAFEIPEPFVWDESFKVFYEKLDEEHKGLFKGVFAVATNPSDAGALSNLVSTVVKHFETEEGMMKAKGYGNFDAHKKMHDDFVDKVKGLAAPVSADTVHFAKDWLVNHIKGTDFKYKGLL